MIQWFPMLRKKLKKRRTRMDRAQQILKNCTHIVMNKYTEDNRNLTNFLDMGKTFCVVKVLNNQINTKFEYVLKDEYSAKVMHITIVIVPVFVTIGREVLHKVIVLDVAEYANLRFRQTKIMKKTSKNL